MESNTGALRLGKKPPLAVVTGRSDDVMLAVSSKILPLLLYSSLI